MQEHRMHILMSGNITDVELFKFVGKPNCCIKIGDKVFMINLIFSSHSVEDEFWSLPMS